AAAALGRRQVLWDLPVALAGDRARHRAGRAGSQLALAMAGRDGGHDRPGVGFVAVRRDAYYAERPGCQRPALGPARRRGPPPPGHAPAKAPPTPPAACHRGQLRVSGSQVTAVGDSVMLASAMALEAALPGVYIDARIDRQTPTGLALIRSLAATGRLRYVVVFSLGTNGSV